jgi:hypothetical protein
MTRLSPSCPFLGVGPGTIIPRGSISFPFTFGTPENFRTKSIIFDITEVNLPFNAIISRPTLYQFMAIAHYGYLVLKMTSPNDIIKIRGDCSAGVNALEKLQALAVAHEVTAHQLEPDQAPPSPRQHVSSFAPHVQPSNGEDVPMKIVQIDVDAAQTTRIVGNLGDK